MQNDVQKFLKLLENAPDPESIRQLFPEWNNFESDHISNLAAQYQTLCQDIKRMQEESRALSRLIGEAKKQRKNTDELLSNMRAASSELKTLLNARQQLEETIQDFLPNNKTSNTRESSTGPFKSTRRYSDSCDTCEIYIDQLQDDTTAWNTYVEQQQYASVYHLAQWRDIIRDSFGHQAHYFYAKDQYGTIKGILPLIRLKSRLFGDFLVSMPYFNYGGAIGDHPAIEDALISFANQKAKELGVEHIEYRDDIPKSEMPERTDKVNMILSLPHDEDTLWQSFTPKLRSQIRRPQRENTRVELGGIALLDDFYRVFARNMRDLGTPVYGKSFFTNILRTFNQQAKILTVYLDGKPVAGAFLIGYKETVEIPWASTVRQANRYSVNMLMYWEVLRFAISKGFAYFDFGRSSVDSGTYNFKKQWGARARQLYWHYWLNNCDMPALNPSNPKYRMLISIWQNMPVWMTKYLGPMIVKNLP